jgi:hypothetical protein
MQACGLHFITVPTGYGASCPDCPSWATIAELRSARTQTAAPGKVACTGDEAKAVI